MAISTSLLFPNELGICKNHEKIKPFKSIMGQGNLHLMKLRLSSKAVRQDSLSIRLSNNVYPRRNSVAYGRNAFKCHAFLAPDQTFQLPNIKTVSMALTRSYNTLQGSPPLLKLLPAVGIICFALWGLQPLMHQLRKLVIHKNDNNWKKSRTYYFMSSYLQPLMLWTGATLICRALDPIVLSSEASQVVKQRMLVFVSSLSTVLAFAYSLSSLILQTQNFFMETTDPGDARNMGFQFAGKAVYSAVWVAAVSLFMELLGFSTQKWLTAGGLGTVLLTLAGREIFTNFLSSAMIHATRPFVVNEWIQTKIEGYDVSGTVEHVGWWSPTIVRGEDREALHIPNHKFTMNVVRNLSHKTHWRIKTHLAISHLDVNKINNIVADMRKVLAKNPQVEQQRLHRRVFLENINPENQALMILVSCFIKTSHHEEYLCVKEGIFLDLLRVISHHRARLATPIRTIQKIYSEGDLENAFTGDGVTPNRSLLLIEPPYKVNGEDKSKSQNRSARTNGEQENNKAKAKPASDNTKTDIKVGTKTSDTKDDSKVGESLTSDNKMMKNPTPKASKTESKVTETSSTDPTKPTSGNTKTEIKVVTTTSDTKDDSKVGESLTSDNKMTRNPTPKTSKTESKVAETSSTDPTKIANNKTDNPKTTTPKRVMEDNIVLGVALDGSKRTLPIEEDEVGPTISTPSEGKELAVLRNGNGSTTLTEKDKTDNSVSAAPSVATSGDV